VALAKVVVVDHYDSYTYNVVHLVATVTGELPTVVQHNAVGLTELLRYSHIVLSPGPGHPLNPTDFAIGSQLLKDGTRPVLGICLGMQGMVTTYGGQVSQLRPAHGELATVSHDRRGVFAGVANNLQVVRYHSLGATQIPAELEISATCQSPGDPQPVVMGVRHRSLPQEGVQFHPESILSQDGTRLIENFLGPRFGDCA
jgi:anthranilate synthase component II